METFTRWIDPTIEQLKDEKEKNKLIIEKATEEIERLKEKENNLIEAYRTTYKALQKREVADDLVDYMMAQVDDCPTFTVEEPDYKRMYFDEIDKRQTAIGYIDQVLQYHLNTTDKQIDEDIDTLIGILAGFKGYHIKYKDINNMDYWKEQYYALNNSSKEEIGGLNEKINKALHRIQLLQMDDEVSMKDLSRIANDLLGRENKE